MNAVLAVWRSTPLVRLFVIHAGIGFAIATLAVGAILVLPTGDLGHLLRGAPLAVAVLWFFMGLTFASAQMGMAIMERGWDDSSGGGRRVRVEPSIAVRPLLAAAPTAADRVPR